MAYRRLPNTDAARVRTLKQAVATGDRVPVYDLVISVKTLTDARNFLRKYEGAYLYYKESYANQSKASRKYQIHVKMARMFLSHFIQVLNMAVLRAELKPAVKSLYGLSPYAATLPDLSSEASLVEWGKKIIDGEQQRIAEGGMPVYNPTIAKVKVHYDIFMDGYERQKNLQLITARSLDELVSMRAKADELVLSIWNQVSKAFENIQPDALRLSKCREYGLIFYNRLDKQS